MRALDKETAIARMNTFGRKNTPFLFIIDYTQEQSYVEALDEVDTSVCLYRFGETGNAPRCRCPVYRNNRLGLYSPVSSRLPPFFRYRET